MKKLFAILLVPVLLISTSVGISMTSLYCKGEISQTGFSIKACCNDVNKGGCCSTETRIVKVEDDFLKTSDEAGLSKILNLFYTYPEGVYANNALPGSFYAFYDGKAPPEKGVPLFILHCVLII